MISLEEIVHLERGEEFRALYRRHGNTVVARLIPYALFLILLFVFIFPLFSLGIFGISTFCILFFLGAILIIRKIVAWLGTVTILTTNRLLVIQRFGIFKKKVNEIKLDQISELSYEVKGMAQTIHAYGTLYLLVTFTSATVSIPDIPDPQNALNEISQTIAAYKKSVISLTREPSSVEKPLQSSEHPSGNPSFTMKHVRHSGHHTETKKDADPSNWR